MSSPDYISSTVEPTFIQMGDNDLINLNAVKQIKFTRVKDKNDGITFWFTYDKAITFEVKNCNSFRELIKNTIPYYIAVE